MIKLQDVVNLPHKHLDASDLSSMAVAVHRNFIELEHQLAVLQHAIKRISGGTLTNVSDTITTTSSLTAPRIFYGLNNRNTVNLPSGTNLDTLTVSDRYDCINFINRPPGISGWAYLEHIQHGYSSLWSIQVIYGFHNLNEVYMRSSQDSGGGVRVWSAWSRVWHEGNNTSMAAVTAHTNRIDNPHTVTAAQVGAWHSGNDGIGSGLDADLVRGQVPRIGGQVEYNTPGSHSWTVPTGIFNVVVEIFSATGGGAGGNGGSGGTAGSWGGAGFSGGGSGAGRYVRANVRVIAGQNIEIVIGVAGSAGVGGAGGPAGAAGSPGTAGGSGGQTSFGAGIPVIAIICPGSAGGSVTAGGAAAAATLLSHPTWAISPGANGTAFTITGGGTNNGGAGGAGAGVAGGAGGVGQPNPGSNGGNGSQGNAIWHTGSGGGSSGSGGDFNAPGGAGGNGAPGLSGRIIISW